MPSENLSVREIQEQDIPRIIAYWQNAGPAFLKGMGADPALLPDGDQWRQMLLAQIQKPYSEKQAYCIILLHEGKPVGHSNVNKIIFGEEAYLHLHLWHEPMRKSGLGTPLLKMAIPFFFKNLQLKNLYCEPYSLNPAPNKTLEKLGFHFVKEYITIPGAINFEQPVNLWQMTATTFLSAQGMH